MIHSLVLRIFVWASMDSLTLCCLIGGVWWFVQLLFSVVRMS